MMLRSSSTPHLGSLLPLFSDSPNNDTNHHHRHHHHQPDQKHKPNTIHGRISRITETLPPPPPQGFRKPALRSPSPAETKTTAGFRRVQSEGNLQLLVNTSHNDTVDEFTLSDPKKPAGRPGCRRRTLEAIPSFSLGYLGTRSEGNDEEENGEESEREDDSNPMRMKNSGSERVSDYYGSLRFGGEGKMYLATGLGISGINYVDGGSGGGGGGYRAVAFDRDGGEDVRMEDYYRRMLRENPENALFLRNYAQFLHQKKRDLEGAEEYYSRAILADPKDGEILSQHAKLIWELHRDKERAGNYFERAVQASSSSPDDSHVHAAYASFLWDREDDNDDDEENAADNFPVGRQFFRHGSMASVNA